MPGNTLELIVTGGRPDASDELPAEGFLEGLRALIHALQRTDIIISGGQPTLRWVITKLRRSSPGLVGLEAKPCDDGGASSPSLVIDRFFEYAAAIQGGGPVPEELGRADLEAFRALAKPVQAGTVLVTIRDGTRSLHVDAAMALHADNALAPRRVSMGSVVGRLEGVNIHAGARRLFLYPWPERPRVRCHFRLELLGKVSTALGKWVRVHGQVVYPARSHHPEEITISDLDILPELTAEDTLMSLRGIVPQLDLDGVASLREEWGGE